MRRSDRELTSESEIDDVLKRARVCHLGLCQNGIPYVVPLNYGYADGCLYIHSAVKGRKIDILRSNDRVSFVIYVDERLKTGDFACKWSTGYKSVMGEGKASLIHKRQAKEEALRIIMRHYSKDEFTFDPLLVDKIVIIKVKISSVTCKHSI